MKRIVFFIIAACFYVTGSFGQDEVLNHEILDSDLRSVQFHPTGAPLEMPIVPMNGRLHLEFDDLGEDIRSLEYTIVHCNQDWTPSNITTFDYLDGFDDARLLDFNTSRNTVVDYMHYELFLPNEDIRWKISGNYILKLWDSDNDDEVVMTLRFVVFEPLVRLTNAQVFRSNRQGMYDSHQDVTFAALIKDLGLDDPMNSMSATVMQNFNWNTARSHIKPQRVLREELFFDRRMDVVFPSMREHRLADLRSMYSGSYNIFSIEKFVDGVNVTMKTDELRGHRTSYGQDRDINGAFVIDNQDNLNNLWGVEYCHTLFTLHYFNVPVDADVYILGAFNQFKVDEASKMDFNEEESIFYKELLLKQGVYDYVYAVKEDGKPLSYLDTEGLDNRAINDYHVLLYYRPFLGQYDRVVSYGLLQSNR